MEKIHKQLSTIHEAQYIFSVLNKNITRLYYSVTIILISAENVADKNVYVSKSLSQLVRQTDFLFKVHDHLWGILCINSNEIEARALINRLHQEYSLEEIHTSLRACILEVREENKTLQEVVDKGMEKLNETNEQQFPVIIVSDFKKIPKTKVKVSIIEADEMLANTLHYALEGIESEHFEIEVALFNDGTSFLTSSYYHSAHRHIIIFNDILARQNGIEVLHNIRQLPNTRKFYTVMISDRNFEEFAEYGFNNGLDHYLTKPIHHDLFVALINRILTRLWE